MKPVEIIGVASGIGARDPGCAAGPDRIEQSGLVARMRQQSCDISWRTTLRTTASLAPLASIQALCASLAQEACATIINGKRPLVIGGDHSCAIGTWSGAALALKEQGQLGLIWIDAHMDSHTPETTPSGAIHGMPLAALLGYGAPELVNIAAFSPKILPSHVCLIGIRSFESGEADLLRRLGVRIFFMAEVRQRGIAAVMADALAIAQRGTAGFGISIDLDAFSPEESPGVGTPVRHGLHHLVLDKVLRGILRHPGLTCLELVEYNPQRDHNQRSLRLIEDLLGAFCRQAQT
ncbi:MAG: arginase [Sulfurimicrobium sp.]|jgi:arginase|nr:arginase [Sulfurimicrobium sp.]MDZ7654961.1 arginase [Sulfurimicrobium sp.]